MLCVGLCAHADTFTEEPDAFLDYIEATGSQYIDTGVNAETGLKARIDFSWASGNISGNDWSLLDAAIDNTVSDKRTRFLMCHLYGSGKPFFGYGVKQRKNPDGSFPFVGGQRYEIVTDMSDTNSLQLVQNGKNTFSATDLETFKTNGVVNLKLSLYVFACHLSNKAAWFSKGKLYELKIWKKNAQSGELDLIRHYLPCIKGGRAGLYDKVHGTISYSFSTTPFVAGPVLDKPLDFVKWVWTNGKQWFDTRVWGKSGLKSEVEVSVREYSGDHCILGTRRGNNRYYPAYNFESAFRYAYVTMPAKANTTAAARPKTRIEYVDSDEKLDYVDLGIIGKDGIKMDAVMEWLRVPTDGAFVGAKDSYKTNNRGTASIRFYPYHYWNGAHRNGYSAELFSLIKDGAGVSATAGTKYRIVSLLDAGDQHYSVATKEGGTWMTLGTSSQHVAGPVDTELPMYLFAINQDGVPRYPGKVRLYSLKLSVKQQDGTYKLARDLVPVRDPATGAPVLWDNVTETYFRNGGKYLLAGGGAERPFDSGMTIIVR